MCFYRPLNSPLGRFCVVSLYVRCMVMGVVTFLATSLFGVEHAAVGNTVRQSVTSALAAPARHLLMSSSLAETMTLQAPKAMPLRMPEARLVFSTDPEQKVSCVPQLSTARDRIAAPVGQAVELDVLPDDMQCGCNTTFFLLGRPRSDGFWRSHTPRWQYSG